MNESGLVAQEDPAYGFLTPCGSANAMTEHVSELVKYFTAMERLLTLPLPTIYGVHLKQTVTLYLFILPLTLVESESGTFRCSSLKPYRKLMGVSNSHELEDDTRCAMPFTSLKVHHTRLERLV